MYMTHPDAPLTNASIVPRGASLLRPVAIARPSRHHKTWDGVRMGAWAKVMRFGAGTAWKH
jgi:hypothetical protein